MVFILMALIVVFSFYEVTVNLDIASARTVQLPDPEVEAEYLRCYQEQDEAMHRSVFGTVDNPDVQREMISTNRERIVDECRQKFAEQLITLQVPSRFNLVNLKPRFW